MTTDFLYIPNLRIIELFSSHGVPRIITEVLLYHELSNYRIHDKIYKSVIIRVMNNSGQKNIRVMNDLRGERMVMILWWRQ